MTTPADDAAPSPASPPPLPASGSDVWPDAPGTEHGVHRASFGKSYRAFHPGAANGVGRRLPGAPEMHDGGSAGTSPRGASGLPEFHIGSAGTEWDAASTGGAAGFGKEAPAGAPGAGMAGGAGGLEGAAATENDGSDGGLSARQRRQKIALIACGAAVTVGLGAAIALLLTEASPPLRLSSGHAGSPSSVAQVAPAVPAATAPARQDSSGASGGVPGSAGAGAACPVAGGADACPVMVAVPAGRYRIGASRSDPDAQAEELGGMARPVAAFDLSAYEITAGQWQRCVDDGACPPAPARPAASPSLPVTGISWDAAAGYAAWLSQKTGDNYRLPTEAEWEYAARAGAPTVFPWGDQLGLRHAHCGQCGTLAEFPGLAPVGSYPPQRGLYDMVGNAYEWVADCWTANHAVRIPPAQASCRDKVQKGGAYDTLEADMRPVARTHGDREAGDPRVGFRVARQVRDNTHEIRPSSPTPGQP